MFIRENALNPALDVSGSNPNDTLTLSDEALGLGPPISAQLGSSASIIVGSSVQVSGLSGFSQTSEGNFLSISAATNPNNNGNFLIQTFLNTTTVIIINPLATTDLNNGNISWIEREPYSLENDLNYIRTDRSDIKGVSYCDPIPVYTRCTDVSTNIPANLSNIAGKTTDAKSIVITKTLLNIPIIIGSSYIYIENLTSPIYPYADCVNRTGIPIYDGADIGDENACNVDILGLRGETLYVFSGVYIGYLIYGRSRQGTLGVDGYSFEIEFRAKPVIGGASVAYTWENELTTNVTINYPYRYCLDGMPETSLRIPVVNNCVPTPDSVGQVLICVESGFFKVAQPVTSKEGWLVNDEGILLVNTD